MMSSEGPTSTPQGDPPPETSWGFSGRVVRFIRTREQAEATIRFFGFVRKVIVASPLAGIATLNGPVYVTAADSTRWAAGDFSGSEQADVILRALRAIALDPAGRADTLLSLDVHTAYLRGSFDLAEPA